ncbi:MAG: transposase [Bacillota bacterium]
MGSQLLSKHLRAFMEEHSATTHGEGVDKLLAGTMNVLGQFFYALQVPACWKLIDIEKQGDDQWVFHWVSTSTEAICPDCQTVTSKQPKLYFLRTIQDIPLAERTVHHQIRGNRYACINPQCAAGKGFSFVEQYPEIADRRSRLSHRLTEFVIRVALDGSCNQTSKSLRTIGIRVSRDSIIRALKKKGAHIVKENLERDDVVVLSMDDINLRKGQSSTACTVFIDAETHRVLVIVQGASSDVTGKVLDQYSSVEKVCRDRACAYAKASNERNLEQIADRFHLVQNIHSAVKEALSFALPRDVFIREGEGWLRMANSAKEEPAPEITKDSLQEDALAFIGPASLSPEDIERRIDWLSLANDPLQNIGKHWQFWNSTFAVTNSQPLLEK